MMDQGSLVHFLSNHLYERSRIFLPTDVRNAITATQKHVNLIVAVFPGQDVPTPEQRTKMSPDTPMTALGSIGSISSWTCLWALKIKFRVCPLVPVPE